MRLNKYLSEIGYCSRREADRLIGAGRVTINDDRPRIGTEVGVDDVVKVDGQTVRTRTVKSGGRKHIYIAFNKPVGVTCTTDQEINENIIDFIGHEKRIFPIGRLDKDSEGLILLTSNGDIVNEILRAENNHEKEYLVAVNHPITEAFLKGMARGVLIRGQMTKPCKVYRHNQYGFRIILTQGLNRQIRLMAAEFGMRVKILLRNRIMNVKLGHLKPGQWRNLSDAELHGLLPQRTDW